MPYIQTCANSFESRCLDTCRHMSKYMCRYMFTHNRYLSQIKKMSLIQQICQLSVQPVFFFNCMWSIQEQQMKRDQRMSTSSDVHKKEWVTQQRNRHHSPGVVHNDLNNLIQNFFKESCSDPNMLDGLSRERLRGTAGCGGALSPESLLAHTLESPKDTEDSCEEHGKHWQ